MRITHMPWLLVLPLLLPYTDVMAAPQQLGTVFFSPAERAALVSARTGGDHQFKSNLASTQRYTITGFIKREDGKNIAWINNKAVNQTKLTNATTMQGKQPTIRISNDHVIIDGKPVQVGETLDTVSGERNKRLPANAIKIK